METHTDMARLHLAPILGHIPLSRLGPPVIEQLYLTLLSRGLSPATVRRAAETLHAALEDAVHRGLIARNPQDNTTVPSVPKYQPTILSPEQVIAYLADARETATPSLYALYITAATCGLRLGELTGVPEDAADFPRRLLHVHQTLVKAGAAPVYGQPKTASGKRTILLPDEAVEVIRTAVRWKKERRLRLGPKFRDAGLLFCGPHGRPINPSNLRNRDHLPRLARLGLPRTRPHDLRHFHGTGLTAAGVDPRTVADRLGHKDPAFTLRTYAHGTAQAQERAAEIANELLTKLKRFGR